MTPRSSRCAAATATAPAGLGLLPAHLLLAVAVVVLVVAAALLLTLALVAGTLVPDGLGLFTRSTLGPRFRLSLRRLAGDLLGLLARTLHLLGFGGVPAATVAAGGATIAAADRVDDLGLLQAGDLDVELLGDLFELGYRLRL